MSQNQHHRMVYTIWATASVDEVVSGGERGTAWLSEVTEQAGEDRTELRQAIVRHAVKIRDYVFPKIAPMVWLEDDFLETGILRWDWRLAGYFRSTFGRLGADAASGLVNSASERLHPELPGTELLEARAADALFYVWNSGPTLTPRWLVGLARLVWETEVKVTVTRRRSMETAALLKPIARQIAEMRPHRLVVDELRVDGGDSALVPLVPIDALDAPGLRQLGSTLAPKFLEWCAVVLFDRFTRGDGSLLVEITHGWQGLAHQLGISDDDRKKLPGLLEALRKLTFTWERPKGYGVLPFLTGYEHVNETQARPARLILHLSPLFQPPVMHRVTDQRLVPIVPVPDLTAVNGNLRPAAARLHRLGVLALVSGFDELRRFESVSIDWNLIADPVLRPHLPVLLASAGWTSRWERRGERWTLRPVAENQPAIGFLAGFKPRSRRGPRKPRKG